MNNESAYVIFALIQTKSNWAVRLVASADKFLSLLLHLPLLLSWCHKPGNKIGLRPLQGPVYADVDMVDSLSILNFNQVSKWDSFPLSWQWKWKWILCNKQFVYQSSITTYGKTWRKNIKLIEIIDRSNDQWIKLRITFIFIPFYKHNRSQNIQSDIEYYELWHYIT